MDEKQKCLKDMKEKEKRVKVFSLTCDSDKEKNLKVERGGTDEAKNSIN